MPAIKKGFTVDIFYVVLGGPTDGYLIFPSVYDTCLRTTGSYFLRSIFSGWLRLFLVVV